MDEAGFVYIEDRKKDMILVSGFNVYPNEVENVIVEMEGILEAAAIGIPDEHSGEVVKVFVVRTSDDVTEEKVLEYCRENLTGYKRPKTVEFRDELPKTNVGKIPAPRAPGRRGRLSGRLPPRVVSRRWYRPHGRQDSARERRPRERRGAPDRCRALCRAPD